MKNVSIKKIAALAGVALLAGAGIAAADVVYGNTQLIDNNGQPTVKIVVGSLAQISDGLAAANIAAAIANQAYKTSTIRASLNGAATCAVSGVTATNSTTGTCAVSNKKVTLSVNLPGSVVGAYQFKTLIGDTIDRTLGNRDNTLSEDKYVSDMSSSDTSGSYTSPLRAVETGIKGQNLFRIGSSSLPGLQDVPIIDSQSSSGRYTEEQSFWIGSTSGAVAFDSSSSIQDVAVNRYSAIAYDAKFTGNDYGIPICTGDLGSDSSDWTSCSTSSNTLTAAHRVGIKFLGEDWVISDMSQPTTALASSTAVMNGGQITLAKEAKHTVINIGDTIDAGNYKIKLSDISTSTGSDNSHPAIVEVQDSSGAILENAIINEGTTYTVNRGSGQIKIHLYRTAPGFSQAAKWAELAVYTNEITLKDGQRYNLVSSSDVNKNLRVSLLWKNRDYSGSGDSTVPDSLREIVLYQTDNFDTKTAPRDTFNFPAGDPKYKLTYNGLDLTSDDYETLSFSALSSDTYRIANTSGDVACAPSSSGDGSFTGKLLEISTQDQRLGGTGDALSADYQVDRVLVNPAASPIVYWRASNRDCYNWNTLAYSPTSYVKFDTAGDNSNAQGSIYFTQNGTTVNVVLREDAGKNSTSSNTPVYLALPLNTATFRFRESDSATANVYYQGLQGAFTSYEPKFVSERGTIVDSVGTTDAEFKVAKKIGQATFTFAGSDITTTDASTSDVVMAEGDSQTFGGLTVKVKSIDASVGSCTASTASGAPTCTVDASGVKAIISPDNTGDVTVKTPFAIPGSLVAMDSDTAKIGSSVVIAVGGPVVNTMTADLLGSTPIDWASSSAIIKETPKGIVVAGFTAADTQAAAESFIASIKRQ